jgi:hypothetical protein
VYWLRFCLYKRLRDMSVISPGRAWRGGHHVFAESEEELLQQLAAIARRPSGPPLDRRGAPVRGNDA